MQIIGWDISPKSTRNIVLWKYILKIETQIVPGPPLPSGSAEFLRIFVESSEFPDATLDSSPECSFVSLSSVSEVTPPSKLFSLGMKLLLVFALNWLFVSLYSIEDFKLFDSGTKLLNLLDGVVILSSSSSGKITDVQNQQLIEIHSEKKNFRHLFLW